MAKLLRVGGQRLDLGPAIAIEGLFATITYRLEPNGRGSRFPVVMNRLYAGRLDPPDAPSALRELEEIDLGLAGLPADRVVWSLTDLRRRDDREFAVNHSAANARDYFVGADGRPLTAALRDAVRLGQDGRQRVELASSEARGKSRGALKLLIFGLLWTVVGILFFPNWVITSLFDFSDKPEGPPLWSFGIILFGSGLAGMATARHPALNEWLNRKPWVSVPLILAAMGLWLWLFM